MAPVVSRIMVILAPVVMDLAVTKTAWGKSHLQTSYSVCDVLQEHILSCISPVFHIHYFDPSNVFISFIFSCVGGISIDKPAGTSVIDRSISKSGMAEKHKVAWRRR